jgi:hypothetical protein
MNFLQRILHRPFFIKLFNWEYWSFAAVYTWVYPCWFLLCFRCRSFFFFAAANPRIKNGGFLNESKKQIIPMIPPAHHPKTVFFSIPSNAEIVLQEINRKGLLFPLIGKPDIGGRGRGIRALKDENDVRGYVSGATMDYHIQEFVSYKKEIGIFYYRYPDAANGAVTGIVRKEFLAVIGDGRHSIRHLLKQSKRAIMYLQSLETIHGEYLDSILPEGEKMIVSPYGNHARGALFVDDSQLIDEELTQVIDSICKQMPEFYFGRLDIRYDNWEDLRLGKNFAIIEVNGAGSEATHIYDPRHSIFFAWKEIVRHWIILAKISRINHKKGHPYLSFKEGVAMFREDKEWSRRLAAMPE